MKPLGFCDYNKLQSNADGGVVRQRHDLGGIVDPELPALNIREAHERPEGMEEGAVMMTGLELENIERGLAVLASQKRGDRAILAARGRLQHTERVGKGFADHLELHRLRQPHRVEKVLGVLRGPCESCC